MATIVDRIETDPSKAFAYYFGYGLEADPDAMERILGHEVAAELGVVATGKQLAVQAVDQIPDSPAEAFGDRSPQEIIRTTWEAATDAPFSSYALLDSENRGDSVEGTLYPVSMDDVLRLNFWDLATPPVMGSSGWTYPAWRYQDRPIQLADGRAANFTLTTYPDEAVDHVVAGSGYDRYLNDKSVTHRVIEETMRGFEA